VPAISLRRAPCPPGRDHREPARSAPARWWQDGGRFARGGREEIFRRCVSTQTCARRS